MVTSIPPRTLPAARQARTFPGWASDFDCADFDISGFSPHPKAILKGLKKFGMFVADNGGDWRISVAPDSRITGLDELRKVKGKDFEVIEPTGPKEGARNKRQ